MTEYVASPSAEEEEATELYSVVVRTALVLQIYYYTIDY